MKNSKLALACLALVIIANFSAAENNALLFGGGPNPQNSQFSIESNVIWFDQVLKESNFDKVITQFGSNKSNPFEISYTEPQQQNRNNLLDLVFNSDTDEQTRYRRAYIGSNNQRTMEKKDLVATLNEQVASLTDNDSLFLTYSGHGGRNQGGLNNFLYLWNNTELSVVEMGEAFEQADSNSTIRYVLPQCYSGGFNRLAFTNFNAKQGLKVGALVCGFTAVADDQLSEGCTESINTEDYRDYASYFYAALTGSNRNGTPVTESTDIDQDGTVSLSEAHIYAYRYGRSSDIPRSTSEDFLLANEHWSERWSSAYSASSDNEFDQTAAILAFDFESQIGTQNFLTETAQKLKAAQNQADAVHREFKSVSSKMSQARAALLPDLVLRWPQLNNAKTEQYHQTLSDEKLNINQWLASQESMLTLIQLEKERVELVNQNIDTMRELARFQRIQRMLKLSRLYNRLKNSDNQQWEEYQTLLACEQWVPPIH
ncbi:hypothetical protein [Reinekea sp.]|uniref:hypothetical protein n=1 Tax=Reinekea sp. TaxID=1970455 RepID=UPI00398902AA